MLPFRWVVALTMLTGVAGAQSAGPNEVVSNGGLNHALHAPPVVGQPYSAERVETRERKLEDGTTMRHQGHHFTARDSAGRVRVEQPCGCPDGHEQTVEVYVLDPVAHTLTTWRQGGSGPKTAQVVKLPGEQQVGRTAPVQAVRTGGSSSRPQPVVTTEELPTETIDNLPVKVVKTTTIVPPGRSGNDSPITKVHEAWTSQDLQLTLKEQWIDPRTGVRTVEMQKFSRAEADAALFRAPGGYRVRDAKESLKEMADRLEQAAQQM